MAYIYKIENDINQKVYIGKTEYSVEKRFKQHCRDCKKRTQECRPLYSAMRKYGIEHFHVSVIQETNVPDERQQYWIIKYDSYKNGYNATKGGDGKKYIDYDLVVKTYNELQYVNKTAEEIGCSADQVSNILKINNVSIKHHGNKKKGQVAQYDLNTNQVLAIYPSIYQASKMCGNRQGIAHACEGIIKSSGGFGWRYVN